MTFDKSLLHDVLFFNSPIMVDLPNSHQVSVTCVGKTHLAPHIVPHNDFLVLAFTHNLPLVIK